MRDSSDDFSFYEEFFFSSSSVFHSFPDIFLCLFCSTQLIFVCVSVCVIPLQISLKDKSTGKTFFSSNVNCKSIFRRLLVFLAPCVACKIVVRPSSSHDSILLLTQSFSRSCCIPSNARAHTHTQTHMRSEKLLHSKSNNILNFARTRV